MSGENIGSQATLPSVDRVLRFAGVRPIIDRYGRVLVTEAVREVLAEFRLSIGDDESPPPVDEEVMVERIARRLDGMFAPSLKPVRNLTGTVLHTNLGRSPLPWQAIAAMTAVASGAANVEYNLERGRRDDRDSHVEGWLSRLTGAAAATVVNNNAAAVLLVLNSLASRREVIVSRG